MEYEWLNMENALSEASTSYVFLSKLSKLSKLYRIFYYNAALFLLRQKPIFLIIHQSSCPACGYLKNVFNQSKELPIYAQDFVMVNLQVKKKGHFCILYFLFTKAVIMIFFIPKRMKKNQRTISLMLMEDIFQDYLF